MHNKYLLCYSLLIISGFLSFYVEDVVTTLERMAKAFLEIPEQFARWKQLTKDHQALKNLCIKHNMYPNFDTEYLRNKDLGA